MPTPDRVDDWHEVLAVAAALRVGLVERLDEGESPQQAAEALGMDGRATRILCGALQGFGYLETGGDGETRLTARGSALLGPDAQGRDPAADILLSARAIANHLRLADTLRSGRPVDDVSQATDDEQARFMRAMRHVASRRASETVAAVGAPPPGGRLLDAGGAPGTYARAFAAAGWRVTVLDLPQALSITGRELRAQGIAAVEGDMTETLPEGPWQCVYLGNVTHLLGPEQVADLLTRAAAALVPGGILAVQDLVRGRNRRAPAFALLMLLATEAGDTYDEDAYRAWMAAAGCAFERVVEIEGGEHQLMLGRRTA